MKNIDKYQKNRGSAIIVTMLFGTVAIGITLLLAAFSIDDYMQVSLTDESNTVGYANEATTELILGAYNYNRGTMLACNGQNPTSGDIYLNTTTSKLMSDIGNNILNDCESKIQSTPSPGISSDITTKIRAYYFKSGATTVTFKQNEAKEFAIPKKGDVATPFTINTVNHTNCVSCETDLELTFLMEDGVVKKKEIQVLNNGLMNTQFFNDPSAKYLRIRPFIHLPGTPNSSLGIPDSATVEFNIFYGNDIDYGYFDSGTTTIEAITEYGGTKRKLVTTLDRQSGTVLNQGDFVLYGWDKNDDDSGGIEITQ